MIHYLKLLFIRKKIDILAWSIFIVYETVLVGIVFHIYANPIIYIFHYVVNIFFFYTIADYVLPYCFTRPRSKLLYFITALILALTVYVLLHFFADLILIFIGVIDKTSEFNLNNSFMLKTIYRALYFIGFSTTYYYFKTSRKTERIQEELKELRLLSIIEQKTTEERLYKAQNSFLKAQINPHFLFNTLNFIYTEIESVSANASHAIILLSKMMRYAVNADDYILLADEIEQIENLIQLHQIGKDYGRGIFLNYTPDVLNLHLIPLVLLTLAENMIKHGRFGPETGEASINITCHEKFLHISTNNKAVDEWSMEDESNGLTNIIQRLKYEYGERVTFTAGRSVTNDFTVKIILEIDDLKL